MIVALSTPGPLVDHHQLADFASSVATLDDWLKRRALANQASGASRTFVACEQNKVVGYYALAAGGVNIAAASGRVRRNMPDPIPVVILGRLAVDRNWHGRGLGRGLFRDSAKRVVQAADAIGIRGVLVHAISEEARGFYLALGFEPSPLERMTLMITLSDLRKSAE
jgi:predicted N-acetyltransferase YhbS